MRILDVDDASIARFGPWPWQHNVLAKIIGELKKAGAAIVVLAFPLDEADTAAPEHIAGLLPQSLLPDNPQIGGCERHWLRHAVAGRRACCGARQQVKTVTGSHARRKRAGAAPALKSADRRSDELPAETARFDPFRSSARRRVRRRCQRIEAASAGVGALNITRDPDGILRSVPMVLRLGDQLVPSLEGEALETCKRAQSREWTFCSQRRNRHAGIWRRDGSFAGVVAQVALRCAVARRRLAGSLLFSGPHAKSGDVSAAAAGRRTAIAPEALKNAIVFLAS